MNPLGRLVRQLAARARQAIEDAAAWYTADWLPDLQAAPPPPGPWAPAPPRKPYQQYATRKGDGRTLDQAALAAVRRRGLPCGQLETAMAEGLCTRRIIDACLILKHAPELADQVAAGQRSLFQTAYIARLRRDAPDLAARAEARMTGDRSRDTYMLTGMWEKAAARKAAAGDRRFGRRPEPDRSRP